MDNKTYFVMSRSGISNRQLFDHGIMKAREIIGDYFYNALIKAGKKMLSEACRNREFTGFTGNTQTSYACGVYVNGSLREIILQDDYSDPPRRLKLKPGKGVYLSDPYEGAPRYSRGTVPTNNMTGAQTSVYFLQKYKKAPKRGWGLVVCTGTEYSEYLEEVRDLDVLTKTWAESESLVKSEFKPIPDDWV